MRKKLILFPCLLILLLPLSACEETANMAVPEPIAVPLPATAEETLHPTLLVDRDVLLQMIERVHSFIGYTYSDTQLAQMQRDPAAQSYKEVVRQFVSSTLNKDIESFQTLSSGDNYRFIAVVTTDRRAYKINMKQHASYSGIWTVEACGALIWLSPADDTAQMLDRLKGAPTGPSR